MNPYIFGGSGCWWKIFWDVVGSCYCHLRKSIETFFLLSLFARAVCENGQVSDGGIGSQSVTEFCQKRIFQLDT